MSKFCFNCGSEMGDNEMFCSNCGANQNAVPNQAEPKQQTVSQPEAAQPSGPVYAAPGANVTANKSKKPLIIVLAAAAIIFVIVIILVVALVFGGGGYKKPIDNLVKGMQKGDYDTYLSAFTPEQQDSIDDARDTAGTSKSKYMKDILDSLEDEYGDNIKFSYKITDKERITDEDDLKEIEENNNLKDTPTDAYELDVEMTTKGSDDKDTDDQTVTVAKIDGEWYIVSFS